MKKSAIYILITIYAFAQFKPLAVVVEDILAHTFWKAQHMATVHYENGHYHVHTALSDISNEEQGTAKQKSSSSEKTETSPQNICEVKFILETNSILIPVNYSKEQDLLSGFTGINLPPPEQA